MKNLKMIFAIFLGVLLIFGWVSYAMSTSKDLISYRENIKNAEEYTESGLYYRAIDCYADAIKIRPSEKNWELLIGVCELNLVEYPDFLDDYIDYLEDAVAQYPKNSTFIICLANAYYTDESYTSAYRAVKKAVDNGVEDEKVITLERKLKYVYRLKGSVFSEFYSPIDKEYSVHGSSGWGTMETEGRASNTWDNRYYGPIGEDGEKIVTKENLGTRLYDKDDKVLAIFKDDVLSAGRFSEGYIAIEFAEGQYEYYDEFGEKVFGPYEMAGTFNDGLAAVKQNGKWGIINDKGEFKVNPEFDEIVLDNYGYFNKQKIVIACKNGKYGFYDETLKSKNDFTADKMDIPTKDGIIAFCQNSKWGYVDEDGKVIIEPTYEDALSFSNGLAAICQNGKWGFIDKDNNIVIECDFAGADYFTKEGSCCVRLIAPENENNPAEWQVLVLELGL